MEDLALAARGVPEAARRDAGGAVEGADEVREVAEADVVGDVGDRALVVGQEPRGAAQPRRTRYWCGVTPSAAREEAQEVEGAQPDLAGGVVERQRLVRVRVEPERRFDGAAAIARRRRRAGEGAIAGSTLDEARGERHAGLVDADVAAAPSAAACASSPSTSNSASGGTQPERQTSGRAPIASTSSGASSNERHSSPCGVLVRAHELVAGEADEERSGHELVRSAPRVR